MPYINRLLTGEWVDPVTRLPNEEFAKEIISELANSQEKFYLMRISLDFSASNDDVSKFVLSRVSSVIKHSVRIPKDFVCKIGDKSFCIVLHGVSKNELGRIAQRIKDSLHYLLLTYGDEKIQIDCNIDIETIGGAH
ncbi:MAG TPA: diguanylate cyclase [Fervidobacterium sp.]|nr:diguanylate cyclase [Fervidobacterium sp.]